MLHTWIIINMTCWYLLRAVCGWQGSYRKPACLPTADLPLGSESPSVPVEQLCGQHGCFINEKENWHHPVNHWSHQSPPSINEPSPQRTAVSSWTWKNTMNRRESADTWTPWTLGHVTWHHVTRVNQAEFLYQIFTFLLTFVEKGFP